MKGNGLFEINNLEQDLAQKFDNHSVKNRKNRSKGTRNDSDTFFGNLAKNSGNVTERDLKNRLSPNDIMPSKTERSNNKTSEGTLNKLRKIIKSNSNGKLSIVKSSDTRKPP